MIFMGRFLVAMQKMTFDAISALMGISCDSLRSEMLEQRSHCGAAAELGRRAL